MIIALFVDFMQQTSMLSWLCGVISNSYRVHNFYQSSPKWQETEPVLPYSRHVFNITVNNATDQCICLELQLTYIYICMYIYIYNIYIYIYIYICIYVNYIHIYCCKLTESMFYIHKIQMFHKWTIGFYGYKTLTLWVGNILPISIGIFHFLFYKSADSLYNV